MAEPCARALGAEALALVAPPPGGRIVVVGEVTAGLTLPAGFHRAQAAAVDSPDAGWIGRLAAARLGASGDAAVEPLYVRPPDATPPCPSRREVG